MFPLVFKALKGHLMKGSAKILPTEDPYMEPGDAVILQVSSAELGGIVSVETIRPVIDLYQNFRGPCAWKCESSEPLENFRGAQSIPDD